MIKSWIFSFIFTLIVTQHIAQANAQEVSIPSSADVSRIQQNPETQSNIQKPAPNSINIPDNIQIEIPADAREVTMFLEGVHLEGVSAFHEQELMSLYNEYINQEISIDTIWIIAQKITQYYREHEYFLSRAYVPAQEINESGFVTIKVIEGYVGDLDYEDLILNKSIPQKAFQDLLGKKPVKASEIESFLLLISDLPGVAVVGTLKQDSALPEGAVKLVLNTTSESGRVRLSFDNFGSRFLGPYTSQITFSESFLPLQQTSVTVSTSIPTDELQYINVFHSIPIHPRWYLNVSGDLVYAEPGDSLASNDIKSRSKSVAGELSYNVIRKARENLNLGLKLELQNSKSDILSNTRLTQDDIRSLELRSTYDKFDIWNGYNIFEISAKQGLDILDASQEGEDNLSRAEATPDFQKLEAGYSRQQYLNEVLSARVDVAGQWSSDALFSSEEFGYGGQRFGKPYDPSEITGDKGIAAGISLEYTGFAPMRETSFYPYIFYDIGKVWNNDTEAEPISASSTGLGLKAYNKNGMSFDVNLALPVTKRIDNPLYGNGKNAVLRFGLSYEFNTDFLKNRGAKAIQESAPPQDTLEHFATADKILEDNLKK